jgi:hypothetical protein
VSKTTTPNALPYPEDSDVPNSPAQIKSLAEALDKALGLRGSVTSAGALSTGKGFTVEKTGTGAYLIKFTTAFAVKPVVTVSPHTSLAFKATILQDEKTTEQIKIRTFDASEAAADVGFHFHAAEPTGE